MPATIAKSRRHGRGGDRRRLVLGALLRALVAWHIPAAAVAAPSAAEAFLEISSLPLWKDGAPDAKGDTPADQPSLLVFKPAGRANGTAVIIAPGGGYLSLAGNHEGRQAADWFAARGVTAFVLRYRLGANYPMPTPLGDAQRAIRLVRANARAFDVTPDRIGMMGFSAGGHLAAAAGVGHDDGEPAAADPVERVSSRPDFLVLAYPGLNMFAPPDQTKIPYCSMMQKSAGCDEAYLARYRAENHVDGRTPPTFLFQTTEDSVVPPSESIRFYQALVTAGVSAELHVFAHGKHGVALGGGDEALGLWPGLLDAWLHGQGLMGPNPNPKPLPGPPPAPNQRFSIDTPLPRLMADPKGKAIVLGVLNPVMTTPESLARFGAMTLREIAGAYGALNEASLGAVQRRLAELR